VVIQKSADGGKTWSKMSDISPASRPAAGIARRWWWSRTAALTSYQGYQVTNTTSYTLNPA
jgi:hypothetical protein